MNTTNELNSLVPIDDEAADPATDGAKAKLKSLMRMRRPEDVAAELRDLRATRDAEQVVDPR
ncbi:MAG TPA: hypothetical protein VGO99_05140 [Leifsonia sp.]|jgi:hypothetical protein|nr:hypothetical protein [Leifsonia sp.]